jgi:hypothetical protein
MKNVTITFLVAILVIISQACNKDDERGYRLRIESAYDTHTATKILVPGSSTYKLGFVRLPYDTMINYDQAPARVVLVAYTTDTSVVRSTRISVSRNGGKPIIVENEKGQVYLEIDTIF